MNRFIAPTSRRPTSSPRAADDPTVFDALLADGAAGLVHARLRSAPPPGRPDDAPRRSPFAALAALAPFAPRRALA